MTIDVVTVVMMIDVVVMIMPVVVEAIGVMLPVILIIAKIVALAVVVIIVTTVTIAVVVIIRIQAVIGELNVPHHVRRNPRENSSKKKVLQNKPSPIYQFTLFKCTITENQGDDGDDWIDVKRR